MPVVWKYQIPLMRKQFISTPFHIQLLSVQLQDDMPCLWAMVTPDGSQIEREVITVGTGHDFSASNFVVYAGTYQLSDGTVWHVFVDSPKV